MKRLVEEALEEVMNFSLHLCTVFPNLKCFFHIVFVYLPENDENGTDGGNVFFSPNNRNLFMACGL